MAVTYGFYDSLNGDRKYNALQMSRLFEGIISDGVFATVGGGLVVTAAGGTMNISVATGRAWFNFTWTLNDSALGLTVQASEVALNRIDTVVVEVNSDVGTRANSIKIIKGTPGGSPVPPTLSNTATLKQYGLANIAVNAGVTQITQGNITNLVGTAQTPFVTGVIQTLTFSDLLGRFESDFTNWLADLQDELDANQAGNLQGQINDLEAHAASEWMPVTEAWSYNSALVINVPSDGTLKYQKTLKIRLKQGGAYKYFVARSVTATTITLIPSTDYTLVNAAITDIGISFANKPFGFPDKFNYATTVTYDGGSTNPTSLTVNAAYWRVLGADFFITITGTLVVGSGNRARTIFSIPVIPSAISNLPAMENFASGSGLRQDAACYAYTDAKIYLERTMNQNGNCYINGSFVFS